jgi:peroxiredoxin
MTELETWQALLPDLRARSALFVAISPQTPRQNGFTVDRHSFTFPLLSDPAASLAEQFGLAYSVPEPTRAYYRSILVNIPFLNGDETWRLPLPATFVLNQQGEILFSRAFADYRQRPEPAEAIATLADLPEL